MPPKANDNIEMIQKVLCLDKAAVRALTRNGILQPPVAGKYNLALCVPSYITYLKQIINKRVYLTKIEYAEHKGVSQAAVSMAIRRGKLNNALVDIDGTEMIDRDMADSLWGCGVKAPDNSTTELSKDNNILNKSLDELLLINPSLAHQKAKAIREASLAKQEIMTEKERRGELESRNRIYREMFTIFRVLRDNLQALALRLSVELPEDIKERKVMMDDAFDELLINLPEKYDKAEEALPKEIVKAIQELEVI